MLGWDLVPRLENGHLDVVGWQSKKSLLSSSRDPKTGISTDPSFSTTKVETWLLLRSSVGNDSSQNGRGEGAVSGAGPPGLRM